MTISKLALEFASVFALALATAALVTLLWNIVGHAETSIDWKTSVVLAILFGVIQTWAKSRENKRY